MNVVNPYNEADSGFILAGTSYPAITMPIYITNNGVTNYYLETSTINTFYSTTAAAATYPSYGISGVTVTTGTQVVGVINYLEFVVTLTRTDINGFVIEIPVVESDGSVIFSDPTLLGLQSGAQYPCSIGVYSAVYCYYQKGSTSGFG